MPRKLGRTSKERNALLRNLASQLLWYGKIETTVAKAKSVEQSPLGLTSSPLYKSIFNAAKTSSNVEYDLASLAAYNETAC